MVEVGGEDGVGMELHAAEVDDPEEAGGVVDDDLFGGAAGGEAERDGAEVGWEIGGGALLVEGLGFRAVDEALEDDRAVADALDCAGCDSEKVARDVELGELDLLGEVEFGGAGDADDLRAIGGVDGEELGFGGLCHGDRLHRGEEVCDAEPCYDVGRAKRLLIWLEYKCLLTRLESFCCRGQAYDPVAN